jgi:uncharacterized protein YbjT (DUF2867 family)
LEKRAIVICGATGKQGGAVLDRLLDARRWKLIALSRDPNGNAASSIRERGVEVRQADLQDRSSLISAFEGAYGVYGVTTMLSPKGKLDTRMEREQGINIADACVANGVEHLVLSTIPSIGDQVFVPYIRSKLEIEETVRGRSIPFTFLGPGSFMDEIGGEYLPVKNGVLTGMAADDVKVPYVACEDIGEFARLAFEDPDTFQGRKLNLIGDFISGEELAEVLSRVSAGRPIRHKAPPMWLMWIFAREWISLRKQFESWGRPPYPEAMTKGIEECRRLHPGILPFDAYLQKSGFRPS